MTNTDKFIDQLLSNVGNKGSKSQKSSEAEDSPVTLQQNPIAAPRSDDDGDDAKDVQRTKNTHNQSPKSQKSSEAEDSPVTLQPDKENFIPSQSVSESEVDNQILSLGKILREYRVRLPEQRKPTIIICGKTGSGKSTTINTVFGKKVSQVGHYSRGTDKDEVYEWEANTENVDIVDLPGLGDSEEKDKDFDPMYRRRVKQADGFIVVVCPPRPAERGTLETVKLLIACGVSSKHIIFGFNRLSDLRYENNDGLQQVQLYGLIGPTTPSHTKAIENAKEAFLNDLRKEIPQASFSESQIIEYDSLSGWNLHKMLRAVIEMIPFEALAKFQQVVTEAHNEVKKKEQEKLEKERELNREKEERLKEKEKRLEERKNRENLFKEEEKLLKEKEKLLREEEKRLEEEEKLLRERKNRESLLKEEEKLLEQEKRLKEEEKLLEQGKRLKEEEKRLREEEEKLLRERKSRESLLKEEEKRLREEAKRLEEEAKCVKERSKAVDDFDGDEDRTNKNLWSKMLDGIQTIATVVDPDAGRAVAELRATASQGVTYVVQGVAQAKKVWDKVISWWK
jgi:predicted GTPase